MRLHLLTTLPENNFRAVTDVTNVNNETVKAVQDYQAKFKELIAARNSIENRLKEAQPGSSDLAYVLGQLGTFQTTLDRELLDAKQRLAELERTG